MVDIDPVISLLLQDAIPTLGERARGEVLRLAAAYKTLAQEWIRDGLTPAEARRDFERAVVDGLQETAHDLHWDTTWPACTRHPHHPLWYDDARHAWCCEQDASVLAPLGRLTDLRSPAA